MIAHEPNNHNRFGYKFQAGGQDHTGWETAPNQETRSDGP
jgi:hypothetical protein